jgi:tryptophan-rich sensory protein
MMEAIEWGILAFPAVAGFATSAVCRVGADAGSVVAFRPPAWVFGVVWFALFLSLGYSAVLTRRDSRGSALPLIPYGILVLLLCLWIVVYGCHRRKLEACWILLTALALAVACMVVARHMTARLLLVPLVVWLAFALLMNAVEVQVDHESSAKK